MLDAAKLDDLARQLCDAEGILIGAGAGMGVDSGLPDFRGPEGFWNAYPAYRKLRLQFTELANPRWFRDDPELAWGFYGHRLNLYRATIPHGGFQILLKWIKLAKHGAFVFTSNVDGHFQKAGFGPDSVVEIHGSIHWLQCLAKCGNPLWPADDLCISIDEATMRALQPLPSCPKCQGLARPNILMFEDWEWDSSRSDQQELSLSRWLHAVQPARLVILEFGAGRAVPTVRRFCEHARTALNASMYRFNVRDSQGPEDVVGLAIGALAGLRAVEERLNAWSGSG